ERRPPAAPVDAIPVAGHPVLDLITKPVEVKMVPVSEGLDRLRAWPGTWTDATRGGVMDKGDPLVREQAGGIEVLGKREGKWQKPLEKDRLVRGVVGEIYPIGEAKLEERYEEEFRQESVEVADGLFVTVETRVKKPTRDAAMKWDGTPEGLDALEQFVAS